MLNIYEQLKTILPEEQILLNEPMKKHTTFRVGGNAEYFLIAKTEEQIKSILKIAKDNSIPIFILGNGSNLLVLDGGIEGIVLKVDIDYIELEENVLKVGAGTLLSKISSFATKNSLGGFEFASGIPGTLGGAIKMNAGAYGGEMKDVVVSTRYMDFNGDIYEIENNEHEFSYRHSRFTTNTDEIILSSEIKLQADDIENIKSKIAEYREKRTTKQPLSFPSAGSTFKRPEGTFAAKLIEEANLKGYTIGGAEVSSLHAGFIINKNNATAKDILDLINYVKEKVYEKFNIMLEEEILIIGKI